MRTLRDASVSWSVMVGGVSVERGGDGDVPMLTGGVVALVGVV